MNPVDFDLFSATGKISAKHVDRPTLVTAYQETLQRNLARANAKREEQQLAEKKRLDQERQAALDRRRQREAAGAPEPETEVEPEGKAKTASQRTELQPPFQKMVSLASLEVSEAEHRKMLTHLLTLASDNLQDDKLDKNGKID